MSFNYPDEVRQQQLVVRRELRKLAKMRRDHLIKTGQMPKSLSNEEAAELIERLRENGQPQQVERRAS